MTILLNAVGKQELYDKHIQLLFVLTCLTPLSVSFRSLLYTGIFLFLETPFIIQWMRFRNNRRLGKAMST
jgi:hypothetical protein